jgi:hypothetical protein
MVVGAARHDAGVRPDRQGRGEPAPVRAGRLVRVPACQCRFVGCGHLDRTPSPNRPRRRRRIPTRRITQPPITRPTSRHQKPRIVTRHRPTKGVMHLRRPTLANPRNLQLTPPAIPLEHHTAHPSPLPRRPTSPPSITVHSQGAPSPGGEGDTCGRVRGAAGYGRERGTPQARPPSGSLRIPTVVTAQQLSWNTDNPSRPQTVDVVVTTLGQESPELEGRRPAMTGRSHLVDQLPSGQPLVRQRPQSHAAPTL